MTDLIQEIEKAINEAAEKSVNRDFLELRDADREARAFKYGARLILPLLKKAIAQRDDLRMYSPGYDAAAHDNNELLKLLGGEHD